MREMLHCVYHASTAVVVPFLISRGAEGREDLFWFTFPGWYSHHDGDTKSSRQEGQPVTLHP